MDGTFERSEANEVEDLLASLAAFPEILHPQTVAKSSFDLLQSAFGKINENAHTRILAGLLGIKSVCESFFQYLERQYPGRGIDRILRTGFENVAVRCFGEYLDALVTIGNYKVIIENKVCGACDQDRQIDGYVETVINQCVTPGNIYVLYLTATGGMPSNDSFKEAKEKLGFNSNSSPGRFFAINYAQDIIGWLNEMLARESTFPLSNGDMELFRSGLVQYRHYLEGFNLLGLHEESDGYETFRMRAWDVIGLDADNGAARLVDVCTLAEYRLLYERQRICRECIGGTRVELPYDKSESAQILKTLFYNAFDGVVADDGFYTVVPIFDGDGVVSMGQWDNSSTVQVDVWYLDGDEDKYKEEFAKFKANVCRLGCKFSHEFSYNNHPVMRFSIDTVAQLDEALGFFNKSTGMHIKDVNIPNHEAMHEVRKYDVVTKQLKLLSKKWCAEISISAGDKRWGQWGEISCDEGCANNHYSYGRTGWAIQFCEGFLCEPIRAIDVFPRRGITSEAVHTLQKHIFEDVSGIYPYRCMKWDGRIVYRFPIPTNEYGERLLKVLLHWRQQLPQV